MKKQTKLIDYLINLYLLSQHTHKSDLLNFKKDHFANPTDMKKIKLAFPSTEVYFRAFTMLPDNLKAENFDLFYKAEHVQKLRRLMKFFLDCGIRRFEHLPHFFVPQKDLVEMKNDFVKFLMSTSNNCHQVVLQLYWLLEDHVPKGNIQIYHGFIDGYEDDEYIETYRHSFLIIRYGKQEVIYDPIFTMRFRLQKENLSARNYCGIPIPIEYIEEVEKKTGKNFSVCLTKLIEEGGPQLENLERQIIQCWH